MVDIFLELQKQVDKRPMVVFDLNVFCKELCWAISNKQRYFTYETSALLLEVLKLLQKSRIILGYTPHPTDNKLTVIHLYYSGSGQSAIRKMTPVSSIKKKMVMALKNHNGFFNTYPYKMALLHTRQGLCNLNRCWHHRVGGELFAYLS